MMLVVLRLLPGLVGIASGLALFVATSPGSAASLSSHPLRALAVIALAMGFIALAATLLRPRRVASARHFFSAPLSAFAAGIAFLSVIESTPARLLAAAGLGITVAAFLSRARLAKDDGGHDPTVTELAAVLFGLAAFFLVAALLGFGGFVEIPTGASSIIAGAGAAMLAAEAAMLMPMLPAERLAAVAAFGLLFAQCFAALSFFPTAFLPSAGVMAVLFALGLHGLRQISHAKEAPPPLRRELALSLALILTILLTAQWV